MPGCALHYVLAARVRRTEQSRAERAALSTGAMAPDMGYFPGGDRFTSDLAHYVRSGRLVEALARAARGSVDAAFARGWATHALADALIHPLINRAANELVRGTTSGALTFADDLVSHIRVEQGLDAAIGDRFGEAASPPKRNSAAIRAAVPLLAAAYRETYRFAPPTPLLTASCRAVARGVGFLTHYGRLTAKTFAARGTLSSVVGGGFALARLATAKLPNSPLHAFARPCPPSDWLMSEVLRVIDEFPGRFAKMEASGFANLPNHNLDTGEPEEMPYPLARATREELTARGGATN